MVNTRINAAVIAVLLGGCVMVVSAQDQAITPETPVDTATLVEWLRGGDPRLVAWGAAFAMRDADQQALGEIPGVLEHATIPSPEDHASGQRLEVLALLDAVIQRQDARVPADAVARIASAFPAQALVLAARLPIAESRNLLDGWSYGMTPSWDTRRLERVSSMLLARDPTPEFVARIAAAAGQQVVVHIAANNLGFGYGGGACGDFLGGEPKAGWPPIYTYDLVENDAQQNPPKDGAVLVIDIASDRIVARRFLDNQPWGSCNGVENLDDVTRHRLLAFWLATAPDDMSWKPRSEATIVWANQADYEKRLGALVNEHRAKMLATLKELQSRGLLSEQQVKLISPKIIVNISCDIEPCPVK